MSYIGKTPTIGNFQVCDAISVVNNQAAYTMQVGSVNVSPESANHMIVSLNGVIQKPTDAFTVSGSTITFASNLVTGDVINFIQILGNVLDLGVPSDATVSTAKIVDGSVTSAKLASGAVQNQSAFRNIIINGDMSLAQRATSETGITNASGDVFVADRFCWSESGGMTSQFTMSQDTDVPAGYGFAKSLKLDCTTTDTPATTERIRIETRFEGQNLQYLKKGTANAESWTISFWVKSVKTGTYIVNFRDEDNARIVSKAYTISSANTWEKKIVTVAPDTTDPFDNDNAHSLTVAWILSAGSSLQSGSLADVWQDYANANYAAGQVNFADNTANNFWITGVQLEAGTTASDFEFLPHDVNFERCKRYFTIPVRSRGQDTPIANGTMYTATDFYGVFEVGKGMRATPTLAFPTGTNFYGLVGNSNAGTFTGSTMSFGNITNDGTCKTRIEVGSVANKVQGQGAWLRFEGATDTDDFISASSEL